MQSVTTRYLMTCAAIGAAMGVLLIPANFVSVAVASTAPLVYAPMVGLWVIGPVLALALIRRPGAAVLTTFVAGIVSSASPVGATSVVTCVMAGAAIELAFLVTLYRVWRPWLYYVATAVLGALYIATVYLAGNGSAIMMWAQVAVGVLMAASFLACTWLGLLLARRLAKAGVARGLASARAAAPAAVPAESAG